jgi:hypothetical protein
MKQVFEAEDERVRALLEPLDRVPPVRLPARRQRSRVQVLIAIAIGVAVLTVGGLAVAGAFGPLHGARLEPIASNTPLPGTQLLACDLIGLSAGQAAQLLEERKIAIEWRYQHWGDEAIAGGESAPGAVGGGYSTAPATVPPDSVVWDVVTDTRADHSVFVFVQAPDDPNAPTIVKPDCGQPN